MFTIKFSPVVIKHLGLSMYSTLPPVLAELITNSYDADASKVVITVDQASKSIEIYDDGCGMTADELNNDFLNIGRNRREKESNQRTTKYGRKVTGKKGIGKLSVFGVCTEIYVESCKDSKINAFKINYNDLMAQDDDSSLNLQPEIDEQSSSEESYTKIILKDLTRKTEVSIKNTADSILTRLNIFNDNFICIIKDESTEEKLTKQSRRDIIEKDCQFSWDLPQDFNKLDVDDTVNKYFEENDIKGRIITTKDTIKESFKGITLYARGKLANSPSFFNVKLSNSHAYSYMSGYLNIDFIDEDKNEDNISTARNSLIWENEPMQKLEINLATIVRKIGILWKEKRREEKEKILRESNLFDVQWYEKSNYGSQDKKLAKKITNLIIESDMETDKAVNLLNYVEGAFEFDTFIEYASEIENNTDADKLIKLLQDWEIIEAKEHYRLSLGRIETIEKFEKLIDTDTLEIAKSGIETMHSFLDKFPWILEPRLSSFDDEITYKKFLEKEFDDKNEIEEDRRIDFLCKGSSDVLYIIEIKRSQKIIGLKELEQIKSYQRFIKSKLEENDRHYTQVKAYIIGKESSKDKYVQMEIRESREHNRFVLNYNQMLSQARKYHQEFIDTYEKTNNLSRLKEEIKEQ